MKNIFKKGFGLVDLLIILGVMLVLIIIIAPKLIDFNREQSLKNTTENIIAILNQAKNDSLSSLNSNNYGVHITSDSAIYFTGDTFDPDDSTNIEVIFDSGVAINEINLNGGGDDIIFPRLMDDVLGFGTFNIYLTSVTSRHKIISVSKTGSISVN